MLVNKEVFELFTEQGTKRYSKVRKKNKIIYGKENGKSSLLAFSSYLDPKFDTPWHIKEIASSLEKMEKRNSDMDRMIVNMPPRHGKSQLITRLFPAWYLGRNPNDNVIILSYSDAKAQRFGRWVRDCVESPNYAKVFPDVSVRSDLRAADEWETTKGGLVISAGLAGGVTGEGADLLIVDDPFKNLEQAVSPVIAEKIWDNYLMVAETRLSPKGIVVIVHTRWTREDLTGRLLNESEDLVA